MGSTKEYLPNVKTHIYSYLAAKNKKVHFIERDVKRINNVKLGIETKIKKVKKEIRKETKEKKIEKTALLSVILIYFFDFD